MTSQKIAQILTAFTLALPISSHAETKGINRLEHIVVIYLENRSFDSLFGFFPGANGQAQAKKAPLQVDQFGKPYQTLPAIMEGNNVDSRFPTHLANQTFNIANYIKSDDKHPDLTHRFFIHQMQINAGRNDRFSQLSSANALTQGYYDVKDTAMWNYAKEFTLADNFFQAAFGGSFLNHQWLICACTPEYKEAPAELRQWKFDLATGKPLNDPTVTQDGYAVNTIQPAYPPYDSNYATNRLPPQYQATIGDRLSAKGVTWAWYAGGWDEAVAGNKSADLFQYHHQPFVYYANYAPDTPARAEHLLDRSRLLSDLQGKNFPQVAFYKPVGEKNEHPGYSTILAADQEIQEIVEAIRHSAIWANTAIIITADEYGGLWDHVAPPVIDRWGPGTRIPTIVISPYAKKGYVDHTEYNTTSILKLIETRFDLEPLTERDAKANSMLNAFKFIN
jgi:phospholipase C